MPACSGSAAAACPRFVPVLAYHQIGESSPYSVSVAGFRAQMRYLRVHGYHAVSLEQYRAWLDGRAPRVSKPVLITFDDGTASQLRADPILASDDFRAVDFVVSGFPGHPYWLSWSQLRHLQRTGRWELAFHAGTRGHVPLNGRCVYFYVCRLPGESLAGYRRRVQSEIAAGEAQLSLHVPGWSRLAWAVPYDAAGQFPAESNDPRIPSWFSRFAADRFPIVFVEDRSGGFGRRYRFEVHADTTLARFKAALSDRAFGRPPSTR